MQGREPGAPAPGDCADLENRGATCARRGMGPTLRGTAPGTVRAQEPPATRRPRYSRLEYATTLRRHASTAARAVTCTSTSSATSAICRSRSISRRHYPNEVPRGDLLAVQDLLQRSPRAQR